MEENNNIPQLSPSDVQKLKMNPPENAWNRLDAELSRKQALVSERKANRFKLLFILTGLLLLCSVTYFFFAPSKIKTVTVIENKKELPVKINSNFNSTTAVPGGIKTEVINNSAAANNSSSAKNIPSTISSPKNKADENNGASAKRNNGTIASITKIEQAPATSAMAVSKKQSKEIVKNNVTVNSNKTITGNNNEDAQSLSGTNLLATKQVSANVVSPSISEQPASVESKTPPVDIQPVNNTPVATAPATAISKNSEDSLTKPSETVAPLTKPVENSLVSTPIDNNPKSILSRLSVAAVFSPDYSKNHLTETDKSRVSASDYSSREKTRFAYATGVLLRFDLNDKWSISSGATYSIISYSITLPTIYAYTNDNNQLVYMYPTSCGMVEIPNSGQTTATYNGESLNTPASCTQVVRFVNVPLMVRYQVPLKRFTAFVDAGAEANFVVQECSTIGINNNETRIVNNIDGLKKMNYSYVAGIGAQYNIYSRLGVFLGAQYKGSINSLTQNTIVNCYPHSIGLNAGVAFHF